MQVAPDIKVEEIRFAVHEAYGIQAKTLAFLALGADLNTAVFRMVSDDQIIFFLKLRKNDFRSESVEIPAILSKRGMKQVIPVISTRSGKLWADLSPYVMILYPFIEGKNGFETNMTEKQWVEFGSVLKRFHCSKFPEEKTRHIQQEDYTPRWRDSVLSFLTRFSDETFPDPISNETSEFLKNKCNEIRELVYKTETYAQKLLKNQPETILCHGDIHGWNLLIPNETSLYIVDWDTLVFAPKERDLMFIGCGLGGKYFSPTQEEVLFYEGYGQTLIDPVAMAYYRYERVIEDFAICCEHIFSTENGDEDRQQSMKIIKSYFLPNSPLDYAHQYVTKFLE